MNDRIVVEVVHGGHEAVLELLFGGDADVAQNRTGELREEALDKVEILGWWFALLLGDGQINKSGGTNMAAESWT